MTALLYSNVFSLKQKIKANPSFHAHPPALQTVKNSSENSLATSEASAFPTPSVITPDKFSSSASRGSEGTFPLSSSIAARIFSVLSRVVGKKTGTGTCADREAEIIRKEKNPQQSNQQKFYTPLLKDRVDTD